MSVVGKILEVIGFESPEKEVKRKVKKEKVVKASYSLKKKKIERKNEIDGITVIYPEILDDAKEYLDKIKTKTPFIISIEETQQNEVNKIIAYFSGASDMVNGRIELLEKDKYYIFLPEDIEIEREN